MPTVLAARDTARRTDLEVSLCGVGVPRPARRRKSSSPSRLTHRREGTPPRQAIDVEGLGVERVIAYIDGFNSPLAVGSTSGPGSDGLAPTPAPPEEKALGQCAAVDDRARVRAQFVRPVPTRRVLGHVGRFHGVTLSRGLTLPRGRHR